MARLRQIGAENTSFRGGTEPACGINTQKARDRRVIAARWLISVVLAGLGGVYQAGLLARLFLRLSQGQDQVDLTGGLADLFGDLADGKPCVGQPVDRGVGAVFLFNIRVGRRLVRILSIKGDVARRSVRGGPQEPRQLSDPPVGVANDRLELGILCIEPAVYLAR